MATLTEFNLQFPPEREMRAAEDAGRILAANLKSEAGTQYIELLDAKDVAHRVAVPTSALRLLIQILGELAEGNAVRVIPISAELSTQEAADLLNISRPHLIKLLEDGEIPFHKTGRHRRILFSDVVRFKTLREIASRDAMYKLAQEAQELGLGYE